MRINTNVGAINASRNIFVNNMAVENSMRKLSSGLKISRAADDAAGLSIANELRTQSRSLDATSMPLPEARSTRRTMPPPAVVSVTGAPSAETFSPSTSFEDGVRRQWEWNRGRGG